VLGNLLSLWTNGKLGAQADTMALVTPIFIRACSMGFIFVPLSVLALSSVEPRQRGNAAGLFNLTRELGGSIGTAWMSTALDRRMHHYSVYLGERVDAFNPVAQEQLAQARGVMARTWDAQLGALGLMKQRVAQQALVRAFQDDFVQIALVFGLSLVLVLLLKKPASAGPAPAGAH
jgi:DHA2 family multidrug resistance protein